MEYHITVIADGTWSKRSYKTNYNALSGAVSIYLFYDTTKNKGFYLFYFRF